MKTSLYPERQRCAKCRKKFQALAVDGLYCSYSCGSAPAPSSNVNAAPRECKREVEGKWSFKKRYRSRGEVPRNLREDPGTNIYRCSYCRHLHVGHSKPAAFTRDNLVRVVGDSKTLGSVLSRMREEKGWSVERLAAYIKVAPARIVEVESGKAGARLDVAMASLRALKVQIVLQEKSK